MSIATLRIAGKDREVEVVSIEGNHARVLLPAGRGMMIPVSELSNISKKTTREERWLTCF